MRATLHQPDQLCTIKPVRQRFRPHLRQYLYPPTAAILAVLQSTQVDFVAPAGARRRGFNRPPPRQSPSDNASGNTSGNTARLARVKNEKTQQAA